MFIPVKYENMLPRYQAEMRKIIYKLQSSKSKHRAAANLSDLEWGFDHYVEIRGSTSLTDLLSRKKQEPVQRINHYAVKGSIGRWSGSVKIDHEPQEGIERRGALEDKECLERIQRDSLSPTERQVEITETIKELSKYHGFVAIGIR